MTRLQTLSDSHTGDTSKKLEQKAGTKSWNKKLAQKAGHAHRPHRRGDARHRRVARHASHVRVRANANAQRVIGAPAGGSKITGAFRKDLHDG